MPNTWTSQLSALQLFTRHALTALIKHRQLLTLLKGVACTSMRAGKAQGKGQTAQGSRSHRIAFDDDNDGLPLVFMYDSKLWLKASSNRQFKDLWRDCEKRLKVRAKL